VERSEKVTANAPKKSLHVALWIVQLLLAAAFGMAGVMKSTQPLDALSPDMAWVRDVPPAMVRFIGIAELAGALGLVLPALTGVKPILTPLAAAGLAVIMVLAAAFHISRGEFSALPFNIVLGGLSALVAWGRGVRRS
jgi:uncharacterized membrane protein YphA (DoxX/SURF4 family)